MPLFGNGGGGDWLWAWIAGAVGAVGTVAAAVYAGVKRYFSLKDSRSKTRGKQRQEDTDYLREMYRNELERVYKAHADEISRRDRLAVDVNSRLEDLNNDIDSMRKEHMECQVQLATLRERVRRLEENGRTVA